MSSIKVINLTFNYEGNPINIFENVSFTIDTDWKLGFIGRNGRGKTTFMKLLMNKLQYSGTIIFGKECEYFPYEIKDETRNTKEIIKQISDNPPDYKIKMELNNLNVRADVLNRSFKNISGGERVKVMIASMFLKENKFLLIDEPTNHLDMQGRKVLSDYLRTKKGYIIISHDRDFLDNCVNYILSINKSNIEIKKGNFTSYITNKERQDNYEIETDIKIKKEIKKLKKAAKTTSKWSDMIENSKNGKKVAGLKPDKGRIGHKSAKMMKRSKNIENRIDQQIKTKQNLLKNIEIVGNLKLIPLKFHTNPLVYFKDVTIYYNNKQITKNINLEINNGDMIAINGKNGCGKSSILKLILGEKIKYSGTISIANGLKISYVSQDTSQLKGKLTDLYKADGIDETLFKTILSKFDFSSTQFEKNVEDFSGGQKKKVLIALSLCNQAHLYIWDEPLNFIDVLSRIQIENLILEYKPTMIFVEHDRAFSKTVATKVLEIY